MTPRTPITGEEVADVLERAADLIAKPGVWAQRYYGYTEAGHITDDPEEAVCFCALGAIAKARGTDTLDPPFSDAELFFGRTVGGITSFNDAPDRKQGEVEAALRSAATAARQQGEGK